MSLHNDNVIRILRRARSLIRKGWTTGSYARNNENLSIGLSDAINLTVAGKPAKFCFVGSLYASYKQLGMPKTDYDTSEKLASLSIPGTFANLASFNDSKGCSQRKVLKALGEAIRIREQQLNAN